MTRILRALVAMFVIPVAAMATGCEEGGGFAAEVCAAMGGAGEESAVAAELCLAVGEEVGLGSPRGDEWAVITVSSFYDGVQDTSVSCNVETPTGSSNGVIADWATDGGSMLEFYVPIDDARVVMECTGAILVGGVWLDIFYDVERSANAAAATSGVSVGGVPVYWHEGTDGVLDIDGTRY
ncbi:hypothetical protein CO057_04285 [Candidatus Uhrbacteria bacterium CG_4_9_14_0_2_um_filter_41_50]|uniref:Uncharacterized protein n=1 Tax=Candidatus Uhrbacteria bacterium CG_4_9_14_0_2_um_filter_41_50 TaxID=1975031 RepID=A0A2M8EN75_9BACT|nr:MAG: hypothetical protein CO057_04285 [Candidatus Uhrbacteria bacterium CG_4_9_14_0_2_um_filter_41_50]